MVVVDKNSATEAKLTVGDQVKILTSKPPKSYTLVGIAKFGAAGAAVLVDELDAMVADGAVRDWLPAAFARFCRRRTLHAVDHRGFPRIEIDCPQDYWRACTHIVPALEVPARSARRSSRHV